MVNRTCLVAISLVLAAPSAFAEEGRYADADAAVSSPRPNDRVSAVGGFGLGVFGRETGTEGGGALGGDFAYLFGGVHGIHLGYAFATGVFGPEVHLADVDYSWQWNTSPALRGVSGSFGFLIGPSLGFVSYGGNTPQEHTTFGGRAGLFADLHLWAFTVGIDGSYRFGMSSGFGAESFGSLGVHAGVSFELTRAR